MLKAEIPYGCYWSTPFVKWQGSFQHLHALKFAAWVAEREMKKRDITPALFDYMVLGTSVPQHQSFYGGPWLASLAGLGHVSGPMIGQACATGVRSLVAAAQEVEFGMASASLVITADRCSNGPHLYYPAPAGPGGTGTHENWVLDNFGCDPVGRNSMLQTAENVATKHQVTTEEQHDLVLRRYEQYEMALKDGQAFQRRYMTLPFDLPKPNFKATAGTVAGDEGVFQSTAEGLAKLKPVMDGGSVTFGSQTHPADGNAALVVTTAGKARELSRDPRIAIRLRGFGQARVAVAHMPEATIPAARKALAMAGVDIGEMAAVKSHNPFAINDIVFARETGIDAMTMNNYGSSLIWGHPQAPTGLRAIIELIEELVIRGGGLGLFQGCAAGDTAMAAVIEVTGRA